MEQWKRTQTVLKICAFPLAWVTVVGLGVLVGVRVPCTFYFFTGLKCPGCGLTRAVLALLHGDFFAAIGHNLLIIPLTFALIIAMVDTGRYIRTGQCLLQRFTSRHSLILMALILAFMAARNIFYF